jgi:hypothetical protein
MREFDELLDEVLKENAGAEPLSGMEQRILARVREEKVRGAGWARGWWLGAASLAACLVVAAAVHPRFASSGSDRSSVPSPQAASTQSVPARTRTAPWAETLGQSPVENVSPRRSDGRRVMRVRVDEVRLGVVRVRDERLPKLDTFPAITQKSDQITVPSLKAVEAMQELKAKQEQPLVVAAIEINPL